MERSISSSVKQLYFKRSNMYIDWQLSDVCNFHCVYCNEQSMGGQQGWPTRDQATTLVDEIINHSEHEIRTYNLLGGEPTLWRHFGDLCTYIKEHDPNSIIQVLTNGSRTTRWWEKYAPYMDKVIVSHHAHTSSAQHVVDVVEICQPYNAASIQVLVDQPNFDQCRADFDLFLEKLPGVNISAKKGETFLGSGKWMPYTDEQLDWLAGTLEQTRANNQREPRVSRPDSRRVWDRRLYASDGETEWQTSNKQLIINDQNHFRGWHCNIGRDMLSVKPNGDLAPSSACFKEERLGNYRDGTGITWPQRAYVCVYEGCYCGADLEIEKRAP